MVHSNKQDEREELFADIRGLHATKSVEHTGEVTYDLGCLELGKLIATGCNAAVYEARLNKAVATPEVPQDDPLIPESESRATPSETDSDIDVLDLVVETMSISFDEEESDIEVIDDKVSEIEEGSQTSLEEEEEKDPPIVDREKCQGLVVTEDESLSFTIINEDSSSATDEESILVDMMDNSASSNSDDDEVMSDILVLNEEEYFSDGYVFCEDSDSDIAPCDQESEDKGENSVLDLHFNLLPIDPGGSLQNNDQREATLPDFDLAVKMMFNYDAESNAETIFRAMDKEIVPLTGSADHLQIGQWHNGNHVKKKAWLHHPNIVSMYGVFVSAVPDIPDNVDHYPAALPARINPEGLGRNMTLFLVMKRYSCTLTDYLTKETPTMATRCFVLCQLLEGIAFLQEQNIAHRDIKSDNLLVDLSGGSEWPLLVISDFGCCLNEGTLQIPYVTSEINKGGNSALMAPEISCAVAGRKSVLDYRKSDVWAVGALIYEIMGCHNPFYRSKSQPARLDSRTYKEEDLPDLPDDVPEVLKNLTRNLLTRDRNQRLSASVAATVLQLHLWYLSGPHNNNNNKNIKDLQSWTVNFAVHQKLNRDSANTNVYDAIKQVFLSRISHQNLESALHFLQAV